MAKQCPAYTFGLCGNCMLFWQSPHEKIAIVPMAAVQEYKIGGHKPFELLTYRLQSLTADCHSDKNCFSHERAVVEENWLRKIVTSLLKLILWRLRAFNPMKRGWRITGASLTRRYPPSAINPFAELSST